MPKRGVTARRPTHVPRVVYYAGGLALVGGCGGRLTAARRLRKSKRRMRLFPRALSGSRPPSDCHSAGEERAFLPGTVTQFRSTTACGLSRVLRRAREHVHTLLLRSEATISRRSIVMCVSGEFRALNFWIVLAAPQSPSCGAIEKVLNASSQNRRNARAFYSGLIRSTCNVL